MRIVFDEAKRRSNVLKHGYDFASLTLEFFAAASVDPVRQGRFIAVGELDGDTTIAVVFRPLGSEAISVISMRRANRTERNRP
jgi:uncharacterized DUF497 family protein